jgi:hypothetical protein
LLVQALAESHADNRVTGEFANPDIHVATVFVGLFEGHALAVRSDCRIGVESGLAQGNCRKLSSGSAVFLSCFAPHIFFLMDPLGDAAMEIWGWT